MTLNHNYGCFSTVTGIAGNIRIYETTLNANNNNIKNLYFKVAIKGC